jgi:hypothetical protein
MLCSLTAPVGMAAPVRASRMRAGGAPMQYGALGASFHSLADALILRDPQEHEEPEPVFDAGGASLFTGAPSIVGGEATLFDSCSEPGKALPERSVFTELRLRFEDAAPSAKELGRELALLIFIDDMVTPRARIRLSDLAMQGWRRPLNISRRPGEAVRIVLSDPDSVWESGAPAMEVSLL